MARQGGNKLSETDEKVTPLGFGDVAGKVQSKEINNNNENNEDIDKDINKDIDVNMDINVDDNSARDIRVVISSREMNEKFNKKPTPNQKVLFHLEPQVKDALDEWSSSKMKGARSDLINTLLKKFFKV